MKRTSIDKALGIDRSEFLKRVQAMHLESAQRGVLIWRTAMTNNPTNVMSGKRYVGINRLTLELSARNQGLVSNKWGSFGVWRKSGTNLVKHEKHTPGVYFNAGFYRGSVYYYPRGLALFNRDQTLLRREDPTPHVPVPLHHVVSLPYRTTDGGMTRYDESNHTVIVDPTDSSEERVRKLVPALVQYALREIPLSEDSDEEDVQVITDIAECTLLQEVGLVPYPPTARQIRTTISNIQRNPSRLLLNTRLANHIANHITAKELTEEG